ncbi:MAG: hypothetical protein HZA32_16975 [Opitutae bacterium]|nr:hypothetical protein [Opitutae bacterium]
MISPRSNATARRWLAVACTVGFAATAFAHVYLSPTGTGTRSGADANNTKPVSLFQNEILSLTPGNTIYLTYGTYNLTQLSIVGSGTAGSPKKIEGIPNAQGQRPVIQGAWVPGSTADYLFRFVNYGGAETSHWEIKNLHIDSYGFVFDMPLNGETFTLRQNILFENLSMRSIEDGIRIRNASNITVRNCSVVRHTKKAFRVSYFSRFVTFEDCDTDATENTDRDTDPNNNYPTKSIPVGFCTDSPGMARPSIHDLRFTDCVARNNRFAPQSSGDYWNGDGYSTERGVYNVTYSRCVSIDNHDGGWDDKAVNVIYENCIAIGNKRGFRNWANGTLINCLSVDNVKWGGNSNSLGAWFGSATGAGTIIRSTFHNNGDAQILAESPGTIVATDSILSVDADAPAGATLRAGTITLNGCVEYQFGVTGTNPAYVGPIVDWELAPPDAFNSTAFLTKGYQGQGTATTAPAAPGAATATLNAAQSNHVDLAWTDNSTNEHGFRIERSANGGAYTVVGTTGTNANRYMDTGLAYGTSYAYRVYAYNNIGSSTSYASVTRATPALAAPATPTGFTAVVDLEAGGALALAWTDASTNETHFEIQRSSDGTNYSVIATVPAQSIAYTDATAPVNTTVHYRVRAVNSAGGANSAVQTVAVPWVVIVDNLDSNVEISPVSPAEWVQSTGQPGFWGTNYHADTLPSAAASFGFVPAVPSTASYQVYMRWAAHSNRADNVPVDIIHAGGTSTVTVNQKGGGDVWNLLGTYTFNAGSTGKVVIRNTGVNGAVIADAICLRATATSGPNAPTNVTATAASGTTVNLTWSDQSSNETGFRVERSTDNESFTAVGTTAANATSFSDTSATAGLTYYYRVRAVLGSTPGAASLNATTFTPLVIILDNVPSTEVVHSPSAWTSANLVSGAYNNEYVHDDNSSATIAKMIVFRPTIPGDGTYQVEARWTAGSNRASNVRYLLSGSMGRLPFVANQKYSNNTWVTLGTVTFRSGTGGTVQLLNEGANGYVIGDAVRFTRVAP